MTPERTALQRAHDRRKEVLDRLAAIDAASTELSAEYSTVFARVRELQERLRSLPALTPGQRIIARRSGSPDPRELVENELVELEHGDPPGKLDLIRDDLRPLQAERRRLSHDEPWDGASAHLCELTLANDGVKAAAQAVMNREHAPKYIARMHAAWAELYLCHAALMAMEADGDWQRLPRMWADKDMNVDPFWHGFEAKEADEVKEKLEKLVNGASK